MIPLPSSFKTISREGHQAVFEIGGLYPGYGLTVANSLRRVLLSSLSGTAITKVYIEGVPHEFSTISNVKEDVIQIILNLKKLKFILPDNQPQQIYLEAKGEKKITGADFNLSPQVKITNPSQHIATLTSSKANLVMNLTVESGTGYQPVEQRQSEKSVVGEILLDANFSPVERVSYRVENMRVGDRTDFNRIYLTIETNGVISPEEALIQSCQWLQEHFELIGQSFQAENKPKAMNKKESKKSDDKKETAVKKMKVEDLGLSARVASSLEEGGIKTVAGLLTKSADKILEIPGMGDKGLAEVKKALKKLDLKLKD